MLATAGKKEESVWDLPYPAFEVVVRGEVAEGDQQQKAQHLCHRARASAGTPPPEWPNRRQVERHSVALLLLLL